MKIFINFRHTKEPSLVTSWTKVPCYVKFAVHWACHGKLWRAENATWMQISLPHSNCLIKCIFKIEMKESFHVVFSIFLNTLFTPHEGENALWEMTRKLLFTFNVCAYLCAHWNCGSMKQSLNENLNIGSRKMKERGEWWS